MTSKFAIGAVPPSIRGYANSHVDTLVVVGSRFDSTVEGLGSTTLKVARPMACPVLIV